mmetsp:Transcript_7525/g.18544  ORF Transcript_7525/g.18544 Transcript_7525/m.18544 type:complete len:93 (+) Transcript_7525:294-572(+)
MDRINQYQIAFVLLLLRLLYRSCSLRDRSFLPFNLVGFDSLLLRLLYRSCSLRDRSLLSFNLLRDEEDEIGDEPSAMGFGEHLAYCGSGGQS